MQLVGLFGFEWSLEDLRVTTDGKGKRNFVKKLSCRYRESLRLYEEVIRQY
jgi:hypothetical protein